MCLPMQFTIDNTPQVGTCSKHFGNKNQIHYTKLLNNVIGKSQIKVNE